MNHDDTRRRAASDIGESDHTDSNEAKIAGIAEERRPARMFRSVRFAGAVSREGREFGPEQANKLTPEAQSRREMIFGFRSNQQAHSYHPQRLPQACVPRLPHSFLW